MRVVGRYRPGQIWLGSSLLLGTVAFAATRPPPERAALLSEIDDLNGAEVRSACRAAGVAYPPARALLRGFKRERELELWAGPADGELRLVRTLPICAVDEQPGPKLRPYDHKTPEGFYVADYLYDSRRWWMWIDLTPDRLADAGVVGVGRSFYLHIDYPNRVDRAHTDAAGFRRPKSQICLHGNCVSDGCVSLRNRDFLFVYAFAARHDVVRAGPLQVHLFPFRLEPGWSLSAAEGYIHRTALGDQALERFWENLQEGYALFNRTRQPLRVRVGPTQRALGVGGRLRYDFDPP